MTEISGLFSMVHLVFELAVQDIGIHAAQYLFAMERKLHLVPFLYRIYLDAKLDTKLGILQSGKISSSVGTM